MTSATERDREIAKAKMEALEKAERDDEAERPFRRTSRPNRHERRAAQAIRSEKQKL